ncbi:putative CDC16 cell division cycle 16-like protein, partial [Operophtera brumata]
AIDDAAVDEDTENSRGWVRVLAITRSAHVAHEAGAAAFAAGHHAAARDLFLLALSHAHTDTHPKALALRPARAASLSAAGLCLALMGRETDAAAALHAALAKDPDDVVSLALLDAIVDRLDAALT